MGGGGVFARYIHLLMLRSTTFPHFTKDRQAMSLPMACIECTSQGSEEARDADRIGFQKILFLILV